ncbi:PilZ domain-containing protein [Elusimicrobiota bacterium]
MENDLKGRRKHVRFSLKDGEVRLLCGPVLALAGKILNLSEDGMMLLCEHNYFVDEEISFQIFFPSGLKLSGLAKIKYKNEPTKTEHKNATKSMLGKVTYGCEFKNLTDNAKDIIKYFLANRIN